MIYVLYATDQQAGAVHALEDHLSVTWHGDGNLESFLNNWDSVLIGMESVPDGSTLDSLFHRQIKDSKIISFDLEVLERWAPDKKASEGLRIPPQRY